MRVWRLKRRVREEAPLFTTGERLVARSGYLLSDARDSVLARTAFDPGTDALLVEEAEYDAWGATEALSDLPLPRHQFTGAEPDPMLGLYHFGIRTYDPTLGFGRN